MALIADFKKFAMRGNLIDMAIGFTVGAAFTTIAKSLVNDIIMPPIGLMLGRSDFADMFVLLKPGAEVPPPYATLADAQAAGAVTLNYGLFGNAVLAFLLVTVAMFIIIRMANRAEDALEAQYATPPTKQEPDNKKCQFCRSTIPYKATRCAFCTSHLEDEVAA
jgi:large conductance mechanosensitive channel